VFLINTLGYNVVKRLSGLMMRHIFLLFILPSLLFASSGTDRSLKMMSVEQRVALVIGNDQYDSKRLTSLQNPVNDARAMRNKLRQLGFKVIYGENLGNRFMKKKVNEFGSEIRKGGVGLFFFAGHGVEFGGKNFLMAKDSKMLSPEDMEFEALALERVMAKMRHAGNRLNIVLLDACRNDPFSRSSGGGLAKVEKAEGMFVAYATAPGKVASDGSGKNGVFTENILRHIDQAGVPIERMFKNIKRDVIVQTSNRQRPWTHSDIVGDFFFRLPAGKAPKHSDIVTVPQTVEPKEAGPVEQELWNEVINDGSKEYYVLYLNEYPHGAFTALARQKLNEIERREQENLEKEKARYLEQEKAVWEKIEHQTNSEVFAAFLKRYPGGKYAPLARLKMKKYASSVSKVHAYHMLLKDKGKAVELLKQLQDHGDSDLKYMFMLYTKRNSIGPSAPKGGDLGFFGKGMMVPEFEKAAFATPAGTVHPAVVKTQFGYHLIYVDAYK
jgi:hypothetical protein